MRKNEILGAIFVATLIGGVCGIVLLSTDMSVALEFTQVNPTLTANGQFDRIELVDRHFGDFNGKEVEDDLLASLTENGTVPIKDTHYEGSFADTDENFCFFLYIYWQEHHLRERISVVGGETEVYQYLNVTVTVSLAIETTTTTDRGLTVIMAVGVIGAISVAITVILLMKYMRMGGNR